MYFPKYSSTANARPYSADGAEESSPGDSLFQMCTEGNIDDLKTKVSQGASVLEADDDGNLLTHTAARNNKLEILKWLVNEKGMDVNAVNRSNKSILQLAIESDSENIVEWLINNEKATGLKVTIDDLCLAIDSKSIFMVRTVSKAIGNYHQRNAQGQTALQFSRIVGNQQIQKLLQNKTLTSILKTNWSEEKKLKRLQEQFPSQGSDSYKEVMNETPRKIEGFVISEADQKHMKIVRWLVENGANPNIKTKSDSSLLAEISQVENPEDFKWLVDKGASIYSKDASGNFALEKYLQEGNLEMIRWAVQEKLFDPLRDNLNGSNLLILSVKLGKADILEFLLKKTSTDVNMLLPKKRTFLHIAALHGKEDVVKKLLENNAKVDVEDEDEQTPIDLSIHDQANGITQLLMIAHIVNTVKRNDLDEKSKIQQLTKFLTRYRKKFEMAKDESKDLSKDIIDLAQKLNLQKLVKWLRANSVLIGGGKLKEYNVLLVGETGVGKSTFINAFVNYINFTDLDEAVNAEELYCLIPSKFDITDDEYERHVISFGSDENESFVTGQSSTQSARSYSVVAGDTVLRFIDTPGIGDTRGIERDRENFDKLLKVIAELENIHAICVMLKPNNARLSVLFEYCVKELFSHLNKSASNNILFLFTNSRGTFYRPGDSLPPLLQVLKELESPPSSVKIPFNKNNVFCMDNESFRFLLARKQGVTFTEEEKNDFAASWDKSAQVCKDFVKYLVKLTPHKIQNSVSINAARRLVLSLSKPLAEVAQNVEKTALNLRDKKDAIERNKHDMEKLKKNLNLKVPKVKVVDLPHPFTGCLNRNCLSFYRASGVSYSIPRECHYPCFHRILPNVRGHVSVRNCSRIKMRCEICQHTYRDHIHLYYRIVVEEETLKNSVLQLQLKDTNLNQEKIKKIMRELEAIYSQYREEEDMILKTVSKFSHFLKHNSIIGFNDFCREYIQQLIDEEKSMSQHADPALIRTYEDILKKYDRHFQEFEEEFKRTNSTSIDSSGIFDEVDKLFKMEHFGQTIKSLAEAQLSKQKTEMLVDTEIIPRNDTFATFMSTIQ